MIYDAVTCVGKQHTEIATKAINSLLLHSEARKIFVISSPSTAKKVSRKLGTHSRLFYLDENLLIDGDHIKSIRATFKRRAGDDLRFGWYLQQFLKMQICHLQELEEHYLIWDSDTILLKPTEFFDNRGKLLVNPKVEHHKPYFQLINRTLGFDRQVNYSFISEHLMVKKEYMTLLTKNLSDNAPSNTGWIDFILASIDSENLAKSGFSEYETYGNFIALNFKECFSPRKLKSIRRGTMLYGDKVDRYTLFNLMLSDYTSATFEVWHDSPTKAKRLRKMIALRASWILHLLTNRCNNQLKAAAKIDGRGAVKAIKRQR